MKPITRIFLLALLLRMLFIPFIYHPDIKSQHFHFQFLSSGHLNIYQYIQDNRSLLPYQDTFNYLPLTYLGLGTIHTTLKPLLPSDFYIWLNDWSAAQNNYDNLPYFLLILKLPYLIFDFLTAYIIYRLTSKRGLIIYLFNPLTIYLIYILGNFDIIPTFLTLFSLFLINLKRQSAAFLVFGIAIAIKIYPLLFLPFFVLKATASPKKFLFFTMLAALPLLVSILPYASSAAFWQSFFGSGLTQKLFELKIYQVPLFPLMYTVIFLTYLFKKQFNNLPLYIFYLFLLFISLVNFHPQWILWFYPFLIIQIQNSKYFTLSLLLLITLCLFYIFLFNDNYLFWGHLIPLDPEFIRLSSPYNLIRYRFFYNPLIFQHALKTLITISSLIIVISYETYRHFHRQSTV